MVVWDYQESKLAKSRWGRKLLLEHLINFSSPSRKIPLGEVKKRWKDLDIDRRKRSLLKLLIWGKT